MLKLYNTLTRKIEEFHPIDPPHVGVYCCGPTVYDYAHIGNFRTYIFSDLLVRTLRYFGYQVKYVMNITDVGHLTSDSDTGEDKMEKGARREGKTAWDIAKFYTDAFVSDTKKLNLLEPDVRSKATEHIVEQIAIIEKLFKKGYAYRIDDGIYFDTSKFDGYGALTRQAREKLKEGARVEPNPQKKNPMDFALWKFSPRLRSGQAPRLRSGQAPRLRSGQAPRLRSGQAPRQMEWDSPWGKGFPGWHIECSAMSLKYLGNAFDDGVFNDERSRTIDIHTGGMDLIPIHHTNEIAQSEAATGVSPFVRYWVHGQFILVDGEKMSKSKGNFYKLSDIEAKGFDPLALRYLYLTAHYHSFLNFTWEALSGAQKSLNELREQVSSFKLKVSSRNTLSKEKLAKIQVFGDKFKKTLTSDLNVPQSLAVVWETVKSNIPSQDKLDLLFDFDEVLGLKLTEIAAGSQVQIPKSVAALVLEREEFRRQKQFKKADKLRQHIEAQGYLIEDTPEGPKVKKLSG